MLRAIASFSIVVLFAMTVSIAQSALPEPFLWLDAANNPGADQNKWDNIGTSGGDIGPGQDLIWGELIRFS